MSKVNLKLKEIDKNYKKLSKLSNCIKKDKKDLLQNCMSFDVPVFHKYSTIKTVQSEIIKNIKVFETINYIYIIGNKGELSGVVSIKNIFSNTKSENFLKRKLSYYVDNKIIKAKYYDKPESVALLALKNNLKSLPIVNEKNILIGVFSSDNLLDVLNKKVSNTLMYLAGIYDSKSKKKLSSLTIIKKRILWIIIGVLGGILTALLITPFMNTLKNYIVLATFLPVIMTTGATMTNQSAMIFIKNLLDGQLLKGIIHYFLKEIRLSLIIGNIAAFITALAIFLLNSHNLLLAMVIWISVLLTIIISSIIGVLIPFGLYKLKIDPVAGTGPFLTIIKDIICLSIYLNLANFFVQYFNIS